MYSGNLLANVYLSTKFKGDSIKNDREIADIITETLLSIFIQCHLVTLTFDLRTQNRNVLQVIIYHLAKYEKDPMNNGREIAERRWWKIKKKSKEKTIKQQEGFPTLSADLDNKEKTIQQQKGLPALSADLN